MLRNVTFELVDIHGTGQQCPTLHEWEEDRIMTDKMCLVMNVFNHVDRDEDVVYRYRIYAGKRFIDALEKVMFDDRHINCFPSRTHAKANKLLQDLQWEYHKRCWHDNLGVLIDDGLIRAGVSLDVFAYRDVEPMAVGGEQ
jgi:hypothetical protein